MTRNQQIMVAVAEATMASLLVYQGVRTKSYFPYLPALYLLYGAYLNTQGRVQLLPNKE